MRHNICFLAVCFLLNGCGTAPEARPPLGDDETPIEVAPVELGKADGFEWGTGCEAGQGSFSQFIDRRTIVTVGTIPAGKTDVSIQLKSAEDVDVQLYDADGTKIIHWPDGILNGAASQTTTYKGLTITYSGYNGDGTNFGNESIQLQGVTGNAFVMKAYGYAAGTATVEYSWAATANCEQSGGGSFVQNIAHEAVVEVGRIPVGIKDVRIHLESQVDVDIQLYDADGTKIVGWPDGMLNKPDKSSTPYKGIEVVYSGYNGDGNGAGSEYIEILGTTQSEFVMKAFGYQAGEATVTYTFERPVTPPPTTNTEVFLAHDIITSTRRTEATKLVNLFKADILAKEPGSDRAWIIACDPATCQDLRNTLHIKGISVRSWTGLTLYASFRRSVHGENNWSGNEDQKELTASSGLQWADQIKTIKAVDTTAEVVAYRNARGLITSDVFDYRLQLRVTWGTTTTRYVLYDATFTPPFSATAPGNNTEVFLAHDIITSTRRTEATQLVNLFQADILAKEPGSDRAWIIACDPATCQDLRNTLHIKGISVRSRTGLTLYASFRHSVHGENNWSGIEDQEELTASSDLKWAGQIKTVKAVDTNAEVVAYRNARGLTTSDVYDYRLQLRITWGTTTTRYVLYDATFTPPFSATAPGNNTEVFLAHDIITSTRRTEATQLVNLFQADILAKEPGSDRAWIIACDPATCQDLRNTLHIKGISVRSWTGLTLYASFRRSVHGENNWSGNEDQEELTASSGLQWADQIKTVKAVNTNAEVVAYRNARGLTTYDVYDYRLQLRITWGTTTTRYVLYDQNFVPPY